MSDIICSLGHSNLSYEKFAQLLAHADVTAVADVRSAPFSKYAPWFNQKELKTSLGESGLSYAFMGDQLGGRPNSPDLFQNGVADYPAMARVSAFKDGLNRLMHGLKRHRIAVVCSERDPLHCHRCLLIGRELTAQGIEMHHIHSDGKRETQREAELRLLQEENLAEDDLLWPLPERLSEAYSRRNKQVAYSTVR